MTSIGRDMIAFFHCKRCNGAQLSVGLLDPATIAVVCEDCEAMVGQFALKVPVDNPVCAICGKPLGPGHVH